MTDDLLGGLLDLEEGFFKEGYEAGIADSEYAGTLEGKIFGIEKGYDKALELGKLHGRALVWLRRQQSTSKEAAEASKGNADEVSSADSGTLHRALNAMSDLPKNSRLKKNIETLISMSDPANVPNDNSDESVSLVEDAIAKSKAKAKMVATVTGESLDAGAASRAAIEDSIGLSARH